MRGKAAESFVGKLLRRLKGHAYRPAAWWYGRRLGATPEISIASRRFGTGGNGYHVCPDGLGPGSVVYSCGVGQDLSFDKALLGTFGLEIWAFDPTDQSRRFVEAQTLPPGLYFRQLGVGGEDGEAEFYHLHRPAARYLAGTLLPSVRGAGRESVPVRRLSSLASENGHDRIDLLKLDIEGGEYAVIDDFLCHGPVVHQLVLEFHPHLLNLGRHGSLLGRYGWDVTADYMAMLRDSGYRLFHVSRRGTEFSFILARDSSHEYGRRAPVEA